MNKIGLLLPRSVIYPTISFDLLEGIKCSLREHGAADIEICTENIGLGDKDSAVYGVVEKMVFDGVTIIAGYINPNTALKLQPLLEQANAIFILIDSGYQFPQSDERTPNIFSVSADGALACRVVARSAMRNGSDSVAFTGSFYDAGYRTAYTFFNSLYENGGAVTFNHITQLKRGDFSLAPLTDHLAANAGDAVFASFCGDMAQDFCQAASVSPMFADRAIYCAPFVAEELWLDKMPYPGSTMTTCVPWARTLHNEANKHFIKTLKEKKRDANIFSMLGWDTGIVIARALRVADTDSVIASLEGYEYDSPRGAARIDKDTHNEIAPLYEAQVVKDEANGNCSLVPGNAADGMNGEREKYEKEKADFMGNGTIWHNVYPCLAS